MNKSNKLLLNHFVGCFGPEKRHLKGVLLSEMSPGGTLSSSVSELIPSSTADRKDSFVPSKTSKDCPAGSAEFSLVSRVHLQHLSGVKHLLSA